ncbi:MAG: hypothetical protein RIS35_2633 [Pseudomonadota bacterium]
MKTSSAADAGRDPDRPGEPLAPGLRADGIRFGFPGTNLFDGLDATFGPGLSLVVGGDGRGKTTLLRILAGVLEPADGDCIACGVRRSADPAGYRARVLLAGFGEDALAKQSAGRWLGDLARPWPDFDVGLLRELVGGLQLEPHLDKTGEMLSTGTRRKVMIAGAIASGAPVTLIDDPFAALDFRSASLVADLLRARSGAGPRAWIVACHAPIPGVPAERILDLGD